MKLRGKTDTNVIKLIEKETDHCWELLHSAPLSLRKSDKQQTLSITQALS